MKTKEFTPRRSLQGGDRGVAERAASYALLVQLQRPPRRAKPIPQAAEYYAKAVEYLGMAVARDPKDADTWLDLGQTQLMLKKPEEAERRTERSRCHAADSTDKRSTSTRDGDSRSSPRSGLAYERYWKRRTPAGRCGRQYQLGLVRYNQERYASPRSLREGGDLGRGRPETPLEALYNMRSPLSTPSRWSAPSRAVTGSCHQAGIQYYIVRARQEGHG